MSAMCTIPGLDYLHGPFQTSQPSDNLANLVSLGYNGIFVNEYAAPASLGVFNR